MTRVMHLQVIQVADFQIFFSFLSSPFSDSNHALPLAIEFVCASIIVRLSSAERTRPFFRPILLVHLQKISQIHLSR